MVPIGFLESGGSANNPLGYGAILVVTIAYFFRGWIRSSLVFTVVAVYGGAHLAEKLRSLIRESAPDERPSVTGSFGVAQYSIGETPERCVARADAALYRAKQRGRDRVEVAER